MATLKITKTSGDVTTEGTLEWCIDQAQNNDIIELDFSIFADYTFVYIDIQGREISITKSLTIRAGGNRTIILKTGTGSARRLRITGTAENRVSVTLDRVWSRGFTSTASSSGSMINSRFANLVLNQCCFCNCNSNSNYAGLYATESTIEIISSVIEVASGNAVNYENTAAVAAKSCTFVGFVKSSLVAEDSIAISPAAASTHLVDITKMNFNVLSSSPYYEGRTTIGKDLNNNDFVLDGPLGALQTAPQFDNVKATFDEDKIIFKGGSSSSNIAIVDNTDIIAYSRANSVSTERTSAGFKLFELNGDNFTEFTVLDIIDDDWIRAFCLALDIPVKGAAEARQIFGDAIKNWVQK